jgi:hypothetical protein
MKSPPVHRNGENQSKWPPWKLLFCAAAFLFAIFAVTRRKGPREDLSARLESRRHGSLQGAVAATLFVGVLTVGSTLAVGVMDRPIPPPATQHSPHSDQPPGGAGHADTTKSRKHRSSSSARGPGPEPQRTARTTPHHDAHTTDAPPTDEPHPRANPSPTVEAEAQPVDLVNIAGLIAIQSSRLNWTVRVTEGGRPVTRNCEAIWDVYSGSVLLSQMDTQCSSEFTTNSPSLAGVYWITGTVVLDSKRFTESSFVSPDAGATLLTLGPG